MMRENRFRVLFPFLLPLLLSLFPVLILHWGRNQQQQASRERYLRDWQARADQYLEEFRGSFSFSAQMERMSSLFASRLRQGTKDHSRLPTTAEFFSAFQSSFSTRHLGPAPVLYGYTIDENGKPEPLKGPGITEHRGRFMATLLSQLIRFPRMSAAQQRGLDDRLKGLFGDGVSAEILADVRKGLLSRVIHDQRRSFLIWDVITHAGKPFAGYFLVLPEDVEKRAIPLEYALEQYCSNASKEFVPLLMPLESASFSISPVFLSNPQSAQAIIQVKELLRVSPAYSQIASFGSAFTTAQDHALMRFPVSNQLPYELWMVCLDVGRLLPRVFPYDNLLFSLWLAFWLWVIVRPLWQGKIPGMSLQTTFSGYVFLAGGVPISLLLVFGLVFLENLRDARTEELLQKHRRALENIDSGGMAHLERFSAMCRRTLQSPALRELFCNGTPTYDLPEIRAVFDRFREAQTALESLTILQFGRETVLLADNTNRDSERLAVDSLMVSLMYGCLKAWQPVHYEQVLKVLKEAASLQIEGFRLCAPPSIFEDMFYSRNRTHAFEQEGERYLTFYDFIADRGESKVCCIFRNRPARMFTRYLDQALPGLALDFPDAGFCHGSLSPDGELLIFPDAEPEQADVLHQARKSSMQVVRRFPEHLLLGYPSIRMPGRVLGCRVSLAALNSRIAAFQNWLSGGVAALFLILLAVTNGVVRYFLAPLHFLEGGLHQVSAGNLSVALSLPRDDELGEATQAFDAMIVGLRERTELGRFVSGMLETSIHESSDRSVPSFEKLGAVLVSDIRGFTTMSERYPAAEIVALLNLHLDGMATCIQRESGLLDRFIGDAVVAVFWGETPENVARQSLNAAVAMMKKHEEIQAQRAQAGLFTYEIGIGVAMGPLQVGAFGSETRMEYTVIGEVRDRAEELEALTKLARQQRIVVDPEFAAYGAPEDFLPLAETPYLEFTGGRDL
jgi:class 3 adenylate cyclase